MMWLLSLGPLVIVLIAIGVGVTFRSGSLQRPLWREHSVTDTDAVQVLVAQSTALTSALSALDAEDTAARRADR